MDIILVLLKKNMDAITNTQVPKLRLLHLYLNMASLYFLFYARQDVIVPTQVVSRDYYCNNKYFITRCLSILP